MPDYIVLREDPDDSDKLTVLDKKVTAVDAGDAWNQAITSGKVGLAGTGTVGYRVFSLDDSKDVDVDVKVKDR